MNVYCIHRNKKKISLIKINTFVLSGKTPPCHFEADPQTVLLMQFNGTGDVNGTVPDYSSFNNSGEIHGVGRLVPDFTEDVCGVGLQLGKDERIIISSTNDFYSDERTIEIWAKEHGSEFPAQLIFGAGIISWQFTGQTSMIVRTRSVGERNRIHIKGHPSRNRTQYYVITRNSRRAMVYINGALVAIKRTGNEESALFNRTRHLYIGGNGRDVKFTGTIFSVRHSNVARTASEIRWNYMRGMSCDCTCGTAPHVMNYIKCNSHRMYNTYIHRMK